MPKRRRPGRDARSRLRIHSLGGAVGDLPAIPRRARWRFAAGARSVASRATGATLYGGQRWRSSRKHDEIVGRDRTVGRERARDVGVAVNQRFVFQCDVVGAHVAKLKPAVDALQSRKPVGTAQELLNRRQAQSRSNRRELRERCEPFAGGDGFRRREGLRIVHRRRVQPRQRRNGDRIRARRSRTARGDPASAAGAGRRSAPSRCIPDRGRYRRGASPPWQSASSPG